MTNAAILDQYGKPIQSPQNYAATYEDIFGTTATSLTGVSVTAKSAIGNPALWRAINILSADTAKMPLVLYKRNGDNGRDKALKHPVFKMLRRKASDVISAFNWKRTVTYHSILYGNSCSWILRDNLGKPKEFLLLDPTTTYVEVLGKEIRYVTQIGTQEHRINPEDIFHKRGLSHDGFWGHNLVDVMYEALGLGLAVRESAARTFGQGCQVSGFFFINGNMSDTAIKNASKSITKSVAGLENSHKVATFDERAIRFQPTTFDPAKMQAIEARKMDLIDVSNITGVPPHKLGNADKVSYNSLEQENQSYLDEGLDTQLVEFEEEGTDKLLTEEEQETHIIEFLRDSRLKSDSSTRTENYRKQGEFGLLTINEMRQRENLPTIGPEGDKRYRSANLIEITEATEQKPESPPEPEPDTNDELTNKLESNLRWTVNKFAHMEKTDVESRAAKPKGFAKWAESYFERHSSRVSDGVIDAAETYYLATQKTERLEHAKTAVEHYNERAKLDTLAAIEAGNLSELPERIESRSVNLIHKLIGASDAE